MAAVTGPAGSHTLETAGPVTAAIGATRSTAQDRGNARVGAGVNAGPGILVQLRRHVECRLKTTIDPLKVRYDEKLFGDRHGAKGGDVERERSEALQGASVVSRGRRRLRAAR